MKEPYVITIYIYMKKILILGAVVIVVLTAVLILVKPKGAAITQELMENQQTEKTERDNAVPTVIPSNGRVAQPDAIKPFAPPSGKLKVETFTGKLEAVNTGCFSDGECYVVVDGKHITAIMGRQQGELGKVIGVDGFGDLESHIGATVEVYAKDNVDGTYTLYGSEGFYIKLQ